MGTNVAQEFEAFIKEADAVRCAMDDAGHDDNSYDALDLMDSAAHVLQALMSRTTVDAVLASDNTRMKGGNMLDYPRGPVTEENASLWLQDAAADLQRLKHDYTDVVWHADNTYSIEDDPEL